MRDRIEVDRQLVRPPAGSGKLTTTDPGFASLFAPRRLWNNIRIAWQQVRARPFRSFLLLQGVIWGAALAIFAPSGIEASRGNAFRNWRDYHLDRIVMAPGASGSFDGSDIERVRATLADELLAVAPLTVKPGQREGGEPLALVGADERLEQARDFPVARGRYISAEDVTARRRVCVLEPAIAGALFPDADPIGASVHVTVDERELDLEVIGVMSDRGRDRLDMDALGMSTTKSKELAGLLKRVAGVLQLPGAWERDDRSIHVPRSLLTDDAFGWIYLRIRDFKQLDPIADRLANAFTGAGRQAQLIYDASVPFIVGDQLEIFLSLNRAIYICCVVMGVMVVIVLMLASVAARTFEIGIRMVEGATPGDIAVQFVVESALFCIVGALLGIPASWVLAKIWLAFELNQFATYAIDPWVAARTILLVVSMGLLAGLIPALKAARQTPARTLRYEW